MLSSVQTIFPSYQFWDRTTALRVPNMFFGIRVLHCLKGGIRDFKEKWGRDSGLKACAGCGIPKITIGTYEISREFGSE